MTAHQSFWRPTHRGNSSSAHCQSALNPSSPAQASPSPLGSNTPPSGGFRFGGFIERFSRKLKDDVAKPSESVVLQPLSSGESTQLSSKRPDDLASAAALSVEAAGPIKDQQSSGIAASHVTPPAFLQGPSTLGLLDKSLTPVQFEQYGREYLQMTGQDAFDGFRLEAGKSVNRQLQASHSLFLGTSMRQEGCLYQFGPTFGLDDGSLFLMARYGNDGAMTARGVKKLGNSMEARVSGSSSLDTPQRNMLELALDYAASDWASSVKAAWQGTWILNSTFSQVVAPDLHLGGDMTWIAANGATIGSVGLRYALGNHIFAGILTRQPNFKSRAGLTSSCHSGKLQYFHKVSNRLSLGSELEITRETPNTESALRFGYEYMFRQARVQGMFDTAGKVSLMAQDASGFGVSGTIDYWKGDYRFGFMMQVVPPPPDGAQQGMGPAIP